MTILTNQLKSLLSSFISVFVFSLSVISIVLYVHYSKNIALETLTDDPAVIAQLPAYIGMLSQFGIFLWAATAAICVFCSQLVKNKRLKAFVISSALISMLLGFDDVFMLHESVLPSLGIPQKIVYLSYLVIISVYALTFFKVLLRTDYLLLLCAFFWFGASLFVDNFFYESSPYITKLLEDGAKFIGIVSWLFYFARTCRQIFQSQTLKSSRFVPV
ncbi:hypothetical protein [uncultured Psychroserpens sp.]|uniref:hypothetical protein n=1 Tax=uncultured Psychroserpens sp. TaxID=255436 RepID=UPI00262F1411|nr:hypothetical protein [uncultured Psychroserpens sp.]